MTRRQKLKLLYYLGLIVCLAVGWWIAELITRATP